MKKINKKGFVLTEILAVTVVVMVIFIAIYSRFLPAQSDFEQRLIYNDVSSNYGAFYIRKLYLEETFSFDSKGYLVLYDGTSCKHLADDKISLCMSLVKELGIEEVIVTSYEISKLKNNYSGSLEKYITYLPNYQKNEDPGEGGYTIIPCSGTKCEEKTFYRTRENELNEWGSYTTTKCTTEASVCETKTMYRETNDLYRILIKTKKGYATTQLYANYLNDNGKPVCKFTSSSSSLNDQKEAIYNISCTDKSQFYDSTIDLYDFEIVTENEILGLEFKSITKQKIEEGYTYKITLDFSNVESSLTYDLKLRLKSSAVSDIFGNQNIMIESNSLIKSE